jgi:hypothetical protein
VFPEDNGTTRPPVGAAPLRVRVAVEVVPPTTDVGLNVTLVAEGWTTVKFAVTFVAPSVAVTVAVVFRATGFAVSVKLPNIEPAGTTTDVGTVADAEFDDSMTVVPPAGAKPLRATRPDDVVPPSPLPGLKPTLISDAGLSVRVPVFDSPLGRVPVTMAVVTVPTPEVPTRKFCVVEFGATVTVAGTVTLAVFDDRLTTSPPLGAGAFRVIVPCD